MLRHNLLWKVNIIYILTPQYSLTGKKNWTSNDHDSHCMWKKFKFKHRYCFKKLYLVNQLDTFVLRCGEKWTEGPAWENDPHWRQLIGPGTGDSSALGHTLIPSRQIGCKLYKTFLTAQNVPGKIDNSHSHLHWSKFEVLPALALLAKFFDPVEVKFTLSRAIYSVEVDFYSVRVNLQSQFFMRFRRQKTE